MFRARSLKRASGYQSRLALRTLASSAPYSTLWPLKVTIARDSVDIGRIGKLSIGSPVDVPEMHTDRERSIEVFLAAPVTIRTNS